MKSLLTLSAAIIALSSAYAHSHRDASPSVSEDANMWVTADHVHVAKEAVTPNSTEIYLRSRADGSADHAELRIHAKTLRMAEDAVVKVSFTIPGGRFLELGSTRPLEATSELNREIKKFRTPFAQEVENNGETVTYSLRARNDFVYEGRGDEAILRFRPHRIIALDDTAYVTVVVQLTHDGSVGGGLDQPVEWLRATKALAHFDSVVPGFGIIPAGHPTAYIEFPGRSQLDAAPNRDVGHAVEALADGNHMLVAHLGQDRSQDPPPPELRSPDGFPLNLQNPHSGLAADVHVSLRTFGGGSAFIDEDHNGAGSTGERFAAPTGMNERLAKRQPRLRLRQHRLRRRTAPARRRPARPQQPKPVRADPDLPGPMARMPIPQQPPALSPAPNGLTHPSARGHLALAYPATIKMRTRVASS